MSPLAIRRVNAFKLGSATATGQVLDQSVGLRETLEAAAASFNFDQRWTQAGPVPNKPGKRRGVGVGMGWYRTSIGTAGDGCGANVHVHEDGSTPIWCPRAAPPWAAAPPRSWATP
jgi:CO/xanthine dehydrogenase Mo-binding subunit